MRRPWDLHPPWAHWAFWLVAGIVGTIGPIVFLLGAIVRSHPVYLVGLWLCVAWALTLGLDWLAVRQLRRTVPDWQPWQPPDWIR